MKVESHSVASDSWQAHGLYSLWSPPGQNTGGQPFPSPGHLPRKYRNIIKTVSEKIFSIIHKKYELEIKITLIAL